MNPQTQQSSTNTSTSPNLQPKTKNCTNLLLAILFIVIGVILGFFFVIVTPCIIIMIIFGIADYSGPRPIPSNLTLFALLLGAIPPYLLLTNVFCFKKAYKFYTKQKALSKPSQGSELQPQAPQSIQTQPTKTPSRLTNKTKILLGILIILLILFYFISKYLLFHH